MYGENQHFVIWMESNPISGESNRAETKKLNIDKRIHKLMNNNILCVLFNHLKCSPVFRGCSGIFNVGRVGFMVLGVMVNGRKAFGNHLAHKILNHIYALVCRWMRKKSCRSFRISILLKENPFKLVAK